MSAKYYENPTMLSRVTAKNVGDVFLRHTVDHNSISHMLSCISVCKNTTNPPPQKILCLLFNVRLFMQCGWHFCKWSMSTEQM